MSKLAITIFLLWPFSLLADSSTKVADKIILKSSQTFDSINKERAIQLNKGTIFKKIEKWNGEKIIEIVAGDYEAEYKVRSDGSFIYKSFEENGKPYFVHGHLYENNQIIWARVNGAKPPLIIEDVFVKNKGKNLCWALEFPCN
ncbi:MAG: hypothetical protein WBC07_06410 [Methylotenera sp.]